MKLEIEPNIYVRTKGGNIFKIIGGNVDNWEIDIDYSKLEQTEENWLELYRYNDNYSFFNDKDIIKASFNIIDLIKPKDIILGNDGKLYQCWKVYKDYVFTYSKNKQGQTITLVDYQIDRVMCYEQFKSISYKLGDDK